MDRRDSVTLARESRLGALSDEAGPQPDSPARSIRLRSSTRYDRDELISSDLLGSVAMGDRERFV